MSLNRKKPDIVEHLNIEHFRIVEKDKSIPPFKVDYYLCSLLRCIPLKCIDVLLMLSLILVAKLRFRLVRD